jgi:hypothetical protein
LGVIISPSPDPNRSRRPCAQAFVANRRKTLS